MKINPLTQIDFYKADHRRQYPDGTTLVYSNFTPRSDKLAPILEEFWDGKITFYGLQGFCKWFLIDLWNAEFFNKPKDIVVKKYKRRMDTSLGVDAIDIAHIEALHDLGYLPVKIKALPEGSQVGMKVPVFTIENTLPEFFWLTNYLESVMSTEIWKPCTTATIAFQYKKLLTSYAVATGAPLDFVPIQCHDFSLRGLSGLHDAHSSASGHLLSFVGTDSIPAIDYLEEYYNADCEKELVGCSVPATEHSVMCMGGQDDEIGTFRRLITETYPAGVVSIVSDTWDFWKVVTEYTVALKDEIMSRKPNVIGLNKVVLRPDSGDPIRIICGYTEDEIIRDPHGCIQVKASSGAKNLTEHEVRGAVQCLWDIFGGTETSLGYNLLDEHIGLIYGDSITLRRAKEILQRLKDKGFASTNVVFGVGSYTYQYNTRDTFGFAMKATYGEVNGEGREIFKDPATDDGIKKSAKGLLAVVDGSDGYQLVGQLTRETQELLCVMDVVFADGGMIRDQSLSGIRELIDNSL